MPTTGSADKSPVVVARTGGRRFLGLTKLGFLAVAVALVVAGAALFSVFVTYEIGQNRAYAHRNGRALTALCALRTDLQQRIGEEQITLGRSQDFLAANPDGIPGIPAALIRQGIATQQATIRGQRATVHILGLTLGCPVAGR